MTADSTDSDAPSTTQIRPRTRKPALFIDHLSVAAEAIAFGSTNPSHWETLAAFAERDGIDHVAQRLARSSAPSGPSCEWWRCTLLLTSCALSQEQALSVARELARIEADGGGPSFDAQRHALHVMRATHALQAHVERVHAGRASASELKAVELALRMVSAALAERG